MAPSPCSTRAALEAAFAPLPAAVTEDTTPAILAMDFTYADPARFDACLAASGLPFTRQGPLTLLQAPETTANTFLRFRKA